MNAMTALSMGDLSHTLMLTRTDLRILLDRVAADREKPDDVQEFYCEHQDEIDREVPLLLEKSCNGWIRDTQAAAWLKVAMALPLWLEEMIDWDKAVLAVVERGVLCRVSVGGSTFYGVHNENAKEEFK